MEVYSVQESSVQELMENFPPASDEANVSTMTNHSSRSEKWDDVNALNECEEAEEESTEQDYQHAIDIEPSLGDDVDSELDWCRRELSKTAEAVDDADNAEYFEAIQMPQQKKKEQPFKVYLVSRPSRVDSAVTKSFYVLVHPITHAMQCNCVWSMQTQRVCPHQLSAWVFAKDITLHRLCWDKEYSRDLLSVHSAASDERLLSNEVRAFTNSSKKAIMMAIKVVDDTTHAASANVLAALNARDNSVDIEEDHLPQIRISLTSKVGLNIIIQVNYVVMSCFVSANRSQSYLYDPFYYHAFNLATFK